MMYSLKGELIPKIVKKQMSRPAYVTENEKPMSVVNKMNEDDFFHLIPINELEKKITETSLFNESDNRNPFSDDLIRCYALAPQENCFGIRVNTTPSYHGINQKVTVEFNFFSL